MKTCVSTVALLFAWFSLAVAQTSQNPGEVFIEQASITHSDAVKQFTGEFATTLFNTIDIFPDKIRSDQSTVIIQKGAGNRAFLEQDGILNTALLNLIGADNNTTLIQAGNRNSSVIKLTGSDNLVDFLQLGKDNRLEVNIIGSGLNQQFEQFGNNHAMQVSGIGLPIQVSQAGNGVSVIIETY